jgi:hypothetical protein
VHITLKREAGTDLDIRDSDGAVMISEQVPLTRGALSQGRARDLAAVWRHVESRNPYNTDSSPPTSGLLARHSACIRSAEVVIYGSVSSVPPKQQLVTTPVGSASRAAGSPVGE